MSDFAKLIKSADWKNEKHVPVIDAPESAKADEYLTISAQVGKEIRHPNTTEHFIAWIALYFQADDGSAPICLGKADFSAHGEAASGANQGSAFCDPVFCTKVQLKKSGTLLALAYCNIHGLWESKKTISIA